MKRLFSILCLSASASSAAPVFEWDIAPDPAVTGFRLYRRNTTNEVATLVTIVGRTNTAVGTIGGYYTVRAVNAAGLESLPSNEVQYTPPVIPPPLPVPLGFRLREAPDNHPPMGVNSAFLGNSGKALGIILSGSDPDGDPVTFSIFSGPFHGTLTGTPPALIYTPSAGWDGLDQIGFTVNDGQYTSSPSFIGVVIRAP